MKDELHLHRAIKELQDYRNLGTVNEFKEALEKQIPKKPKNIEILGEPFFEDEMNLKYGDCSICNTEVFGDLDWCPYCGNRLDWSEADGKEIRS